MPDKSPVQPSEARTKRARPTRTCVGCGAHDDAAEMVHVVVCDEGVAFDTLFAGGGGLVGLGARGRGAHVHARAACIEKAPAWAFAHSAPACRRQRWRAREPPDRRLRPPHVGPPRLGSASRAGRRRRRGGARRREARGAARRGGGRRGDDRGEDRGHRGDRERARASPGARRSSWGPARFGHGRHRRSRSARSVTKGLRRN